MEEEVLAKVKTDSFNTGKRVGFDLGMLIGLAVGSILTFAFMSYVIHLIK